jgi:hypothetical protein
MIKSSLNLFGGVIGKTPVNDDMHIDYKLGVIIAPSAMHLKKDIINYLSGYCLNNAQLNNTSFYKSWTKVANVTLEERLRDQLTHYFTTYGLMSLGLDSPNFVYIPVDEFQEDAPKNLKLRVIKGYSKEALIKGCFDVLKSGVALQESTIQDIIDILNECEYKFTGEEEIKNREAKIYFAKITNILPKNGDDLFRYLIYSATEKTLIIKNKTLIDEIKKSEYQLKLTDDQIVELSKSFHRYKTLCLAFKNKFAKNKRVINRIAKLAKKHHVPQKVNVLSNLTSKEFDVDTIKHSAKKANIFQLVRALNAMDYYSSGTYNRYYRIRNGKSYAKTKSYSPKNNSAFPILIDELKSRIKNKKLYIPKHVDYAVPVSEKMYTGSIPKNTKISASYKEGENLLIGVYWQSDYHSDLDLSAISTNEKIGWNRSWNNESLMYSGDITSAYKGASEWLYCKQIQYPYLVNLNAFNCPEKQKYKLIIGYSKDKIDHNYMIDPNNILFQTECEMDQKQKIIGMIAPNQNNDGVEFSIIDQSFGNKTVSSFKEHDVTARSAILSQVENCLRLRDIFEVVDNKEDADVVLEPNDLSKDSILKLFAD